MEETRIIGFGIAEGDDALHKAMHRTVCSFNTRRQLVNAKSVLVAVFVQITRTDNMDIFLRLSEIMDKDASITVQSMPGEGLKNHQVAVAICKTDARGGLDAH